MDYYKNLTNNNAFHIWHDFLPLEPQYVKYGDSNPSVLAAARKIVDVYRAYADARAAFLYAHEKSYGDLEGKGDDNHLFVKAFFLKSAILQYGLCLDLCWQVVWAYIHSDSLGYLLKNDFSELEKQCTCNKLMEELEKRNSDTTVATLQNMISNLNGDSAIKVLREQYRIMKHRGSLRIKGADDAPEVTKLCFWGQTVDSDIRAEHSIEEIEKIIFDYHNSFYKHFTLIIGEIIPEDYTSGKIELNDYMAMSSKIRSEMSTI